MGCALLDLSQILNPGVPDEFLPPIMPIAFYGDESETTGKVFTLAGWVGVPSAWRTFTPPWRDMLSCFGPDPVLALHTIDLASRRGGGEFTGWSRRERTEFLGRAGDLIVDKDILGPLAFGVASSIEVGEFERLAPNLKLTPEDLYVICFRSIFHQVVTHGIEEDISFVLDEKEAVKKRVTEFFYQAKEEFVAAGLGTKIRGISFDDDRVVIPLQAADYLAYEVRRGILNRRRDAVYKERQTYTRLKERRGSIFRCYGRRFLANLTAAQIAQPNESLHDLWFTVEAPED